MAISKTQAAALKYFKKAETVRREALFQSVALSGYALKSVIAAWLKVSVTMQYDASKPPDDDVGKWAWLWRSCVFNPYDLSLLTGQREEVLFTLSRARGHRLIYPDGTISKLSEIEILLPVMGNGDKIQYGLTKKKTKKKTVKKTKKTKTV